jgi:PAS domain S-box-containing protein
MDSVSIPVKNHKILIIDDNINLCKSMKMIFEKKGFSSDIIHSGKDALARLEEHSYDLVFLDIRLPDIEGMKLLHKLSEIYPTTDVVIITGHASIETAINAIEHEADGYITKPLDMDVVLETVNRLLERRDLIEEKERAKAALQEERDRAQMYLDVAGVIMLALDAEGNITLLNKKGCEILGYSVDEVLGRNWFETFIPEQNRDSIRSVFNELVDNESCEVFENEILTSQGIIRHILWHNSVIQDVNGSVIGTLSSGEDITEQKEAEKALRQSEERFQAMFRYAPMGAAVLDMDGTLLLSNLALQKMVGYSGEELSRMKFMEFTHPADIDVDWKLFKGLVEGKRDHYSLEKRYYHKDGHLVWGSLGVSIIRDIKGNPNLVIEMVQDVTEQKETQNEIQRLLEIQIATSELALAVGRTRNPEVVHRTIYEHISQLMDVQSLIITYYDNDKKLITAGYMIHKNKEVDVSDFPPIPLESEDFEAQSIAIRTKKPFYVSNQAEVLRKTTSRYSVHEDGAVTEKEKLSVKSTVYVPMLWGGEVLGLLQVQSHEIDAYNQEDIDVLSSLANVAALSIKNAFFFDELRILNEELETRVVERTRELENANRELEAFAYSVSHDLRAPLRSINGFSNALSEDYKDILDDTATDYLDRISSSAIRMDQLIKDLLQLSRITRTEMKKSKVNLSNIVEKAVVAIRERYPEHKVSIKISEGLTALCDERLLYLVLENLLDNAWKFTRKKKAAKIEFGRIQTEDEGIYFVKDNGAGFDMKYADKLFGAFQRLHKTEDYKGTGIGLATIRRIINRHGGRVWAEGKVDKGAIFYFTLPGKKGEV